MTEWGVVGVIISLVGLGAAIIKPVVSLTKAITQLTVVVEGMKSDLEHQRAYSRESHKELWSHNETQDKELEDHERRIGVLEAKHEG